MRGRLMASEYRNGRPDVLTDQRGSGTTHMNKPVARSHSPQTPARRPERHG
jgi:hypothetical protein